MNTKPIDRQRIRKQLGRGTLTAKEATALRQARFVMLGVGSVDRPLAEHIAEMGAGYFTVIDPKAYGPRSVASQCTPAEVGRQKAEVAAERLRVLGAHVDPFARDLYNVPAGVIDHESIVIASLDNRRADIGANRWAAKMGARLLKINIEPQWETVSLRAYDLRSKVAQCVECQFTRRHYERQRHPRSCDGPAVGRRTNSPRWLSEAAAFLGSLAVLDLVAGGEAADRWYGREWQYRHETATLAASELVANPHCRWDHDKRWPNVQRRNEGPDKLCLQTLLDEAGAGDATRIRFCQEVSCQSRCVDCGKTNDTPRWISDPAHAVGNCECGGDLDPVPYFTFSELTARQLETVADLPLSDWGVEPLAAMEIQLARGAITFVVGDSAGRNLSPHHEGGV